MQEPFGEYFFSSRYVYHVDNDQIWSMTIGFPSRCDKQSVGGIIHQSHGTFPNFEIFDDLGRSQVTKILGNDFPFPLENRKVDLPELQGDAYSVARQKCRLAAEQVWFGKSSLLIRYLVLHPMFSLFGSLFVFFLVSFLSHK